MLTIKSTLEDSFDHNATIFDYLKYKDYSPIAIRNKNSAIKYLILNKPLSEFDEDALLANKVEIKKG